MISSLDYILEEENDFVKGKTIKTFLKFTSRAVKHYSEVDEGVFLKKLDNYNFLVYNPADDITTLAFKGNIVKIEVMGDISSSI